MDLGALERQWHGTQRQAETQKPLASIIMALICVLVRDAYQQLVRQALQDIERQFRIRTMTGHDEDMDVDEARKEFMVIHLNGMVQTDDKIALKEIMRQLSREGESEVDVSVRVPDCLLDPREHVVDGAHATDSFCVW